MNRTVIGGSACPPAMMRTFKETYGVDVPPRLGHDRDEPRSAPRATFKSKHLADAGGALRRDGQQGRIIYGVDMKIVGEDGKELPWDGQSFGDLLVRGPWIVNRYFRARRRSAGERLVPDRRRGHASTPTATCRSPTAART